MKYSLHDTIFRTYGETVSIKLCKLITFYIEQDLWRKTYIWEKEYYVNLFANRWNIKDLDLLCRYINQCMNKLLKEEYHNTQRRIKYSLFTEPLLSTGLGHAPPRTKYNTKRAEKETDANGLDFGTEYKKRFGRPSDNLAQYKRFYNYYRSKNKFPW